MGPKTARELAAEVVMDNLRAALGGTLTVEDAIQKIASICEEKVFRAVRFATSVERERCAKIAEDFAPNYRACHKIAKKIRGGEKS